MLWHRETTLDLEKCLSKSTQLVFQSQFPAGVNQLLIIQNRFGSGKNYQRCLLWHLDSYHVVAPKQQTNTGFQDLGARIWWNVRRTWEGWRWCKCFWISTHVYMFISYVSYTSMHAAQNQGFWHVLAVCNMYTFIYVSINTHCVVIHFVDVDSVYIYIYLYTYFFTY